jgi:signal peptidase II
MSRRIARLAVFVTVFLLTAGFDQGTKEWARTLPTTPAECSMADLAAHRCAGIPQPVIEGYWDWELAKNPGAAFSSFAGGVGTQIILSVIAMVALIALGVAAARTRPEERLRRVGYALIAGGALGNLIDRFRDGAVTDFVRWRYHDMKWPIFNVADAALFIGAALFVIEAARLYVRERRSARTT